MRRAAFFSLGLLLSLLALLCPATAGEDGGAKVIPSEICRGLFIVPVSFGEEGKALRLVLDTGAWRTSVDPESIERVFGKKVRGGRSFTLKNGRAGPMTIGRLKVRVHPLRHISRALGREIDGILGFSTFADLLLTLDYPAGEVRVGKGRLPEPDGVTVFEDVGRARPYLAVDVGGEPLPVLIDSGSTGALELRPTDPLVWDVAPRPLSAAARYDSIEVDAEGRLGADLLLGPLRLERPIVETTEGTRLVGAEVLGRLDMTFDQKTRRIRIHAEGDEPLRMPSVRGIGAAFRPLERGLEVIRVFPGLPAASAGLEEGDVVVALDGRPVYEWGCDRPLSNGTSPGRILFTVRRGDDLEDLEIERAVLIP